MNENVIAELNVEPAAKKKKKKKTKNTQTVF